MAPLWTHPSPHLTRLDAFRRHINKQYNEHIRDYTSLHRWSVENLDLFYRELWNFSGLVTSKPPLAVANSLAAMWPRPQWFPGAEMNFTENVLATGLAAHPDMTAVSACREGGTEWRHLSWLQLRDQVALYASALQNAGVGKGDRVATVVTNSLEAILIALASGAIGAIFSSTSPDTGPKGIVERFAQIQPKILFVESQVLYASKRRNLRERLSAAVDELKTKVTGLDKIIVINDPAWKKSGLRGGLLRNIDLTLDASVESRLRGSSKRLLDLSSLSKYLLIIQSTSYSRKLPQFNYLGIEATPKETNPADTVWLTMNSSGTTGTPKCICHSGGAVLLKNKLDLALGIDMGIDSTYYQYTTKNDRKLTLHTSDHQTGWMMWNMLIGALSLGSRIVLYDGSPLHPTPSFQLSLLESQGVTHWGTSPKFLAGLRSDPESSGIARRLESLQNVLVSGSPLSTSLAAWFYADNFQRHVGLHNASGGTDLVGGIVGGNSLSSVVGSEMAAATLGIKVEIWNGDGKNTVPSGEIGELVITKPFVSMPVKFWGDDATGNRYFDTYFSLYPGVWSHGDLISRNVATGGYSIHGRSDGVLNPGGIDGCPILRALPVVLVRVRFGTAELYDVVSRFPEIEDSVVVSQRVRRCQQNGESDIEDERVVMFIKMKSPGDALDDSLRSRIAEEIRRTLSARHVPEEMWQVKDIPCTMNGKKIEKVVKALVAGEKVTMRGSIANPECLEEYVKFSTPGKLMARL
ncbi:unnamed protein product [Clonostachys rhizophaga]|uniref:AMP-dependent synthetase/ligase domain-containing protein n=1 Tax=Clonostachys rhizophaga TaxID=160324 RepID=A0A9N9VP73_9HYPO|nr:unnamed protein product [Clonostachys rhizophaga]